jgi:formate--tetrahydrofolate ligase
MNDTAAMLALSPDDLIPYGNDVAKVSLDAIGSGANEGQLVLVTAMSPSPSGEGKTTTSIGLADALRCIGKSAAVCVREPSLGPVFGIKGGGTGAGRAELTPADRINLHFTGDFHAVTSAHNLLAAVLDNHLHFGNALRIDTRRVLWPRVMDMNDRSLRDMVVGLGGRLQGVPRQARFDITAASEVMAILALARNYDDLRERLDRIAVAYDLDGQIVRAGQLQTGGATSVLLRDALLPNLVRTLGGTPAVVHCGPFANIAHGTSSIVGTSLALGRADYVVQEAGFGADLGAEKFLHIFSRQLGRYPSVAVVVATLRALRYQGGAGVDYAQAGSVPLENGLPNLRAHLKALAGLGLPTVVAINRMAGDSAEDLELVRKAVEPSFIVNVFDEGGQGALELAEWVAHHARKPAAIRPLYQLEDALTTKLDAVATGFYGATGVSLSAQAQQELASAESAGFGRSYVCIAKTQYSLSDNPLAVGAPSPGPLHVRGLNILGGAGFVVPLAGDMMTMPGLPRRPNLEHIGLNGDGSIRLKA